MAYVMIINFTSCLQVDKKNCGSQVLLLSTALLFWRYTIARCKARSNEVYLSKVNSVWDVGYVIQTVVAVTVA